MRPVYPETIPLWSCTSNMSMDWFKGKFTGLSPIFHGKIYGFRLRFSQQNQSIEDVVSCNFRKLISSRCS